MRRSEMREHVFKLLFRVEFYESEELEEQDRLYFDTIVLDEEVPNAVSEKDRRVIVDRTRQIGEKLPEVNDRLSGLAVGWKPERIGKVELTILRLALYEILFDEEVPAGVAINEAVELAKKYGGDDSPSFVNGILGKMTREA